MSSFHWPIDEQYSRGGPIIAVQVENEYGSYAMDEEYMPFIKEVRNPVFKNPLRLLSEFTKTRTGTL